jgi:hypothetical protein
MSSAKAGSFFSCSFPVTSDGRRPEQSMDTGGARLAGPTGLLHISSSAVPRNWFLLPEAGWKSQ